MTFLPIVERELRVISRQGSAYWMRFGAAGLALGLAALMLLANRTATVSELARFIFFAISIACLGLAMLAGVFLTADCLSEERREGTLGLLFLTDLKGYDVVLGKLVSTSLLSVFCLLAVLPILALPLLMGGISGGEFSRTALVLVVTIFFSLSTAMLVSALSKDSRVAMLGSLLVMVVLAGLLPVLWWLQHLMPRVRELDFLLWACPAYTFRRALDAFYAWRLGPGEFWASIATLSSLGLVSLVVASVLLPRGWQEAPTARAGSGSASGRSRMRFGSPARQTARRGWLNTRPFYWLATRDRLPGLWAGLSLGALLPVWLACYAGVLATPRGTAEYFFTVALFMSYGMHLIYKCLVATEATRRLSEDRHSGALELLLVTPLSLRDIIRGQQDAVWDAFRWSRGLLLAVNGLLVWLMVGPNPIHFPEEPRQFFCLLLIGGSVALYLDTFALTRAGIWAALTAKRHTRAVLRTLRQVLLPPWLAVLLLFLLEAVGTPARQGTMETLVTLWFLIGAGVDAAVGITAASKLEAHFRSAAAGVVSRRGLVTDPLPSLAEKPVQA